MERLRNLIDGQLCAPEGADTIDMYEPAVGAVYAGAPDTPQAEVDRAIDAASRVFPAWRDTPASERAAALARLADLIERDLEPLARAESIDSGKPISLARAVDIPRAASNFRFFARAIQHTTGEAYFTDATGPQGGSAINYVQRVPRGVVAAISPWNLPLYLLTWKIAPALAAGCTVVAKPSEVTPMTGAMLGVLAIEAGLPAGVLNIVHGRGPSVGARLVTHPDTTTITFTGSTAVGRWIGEKAGAMLKRVSLELGGKNPLLIFDDADLDAPGGALDLAARAAFSNQGQICLCGSRIIAHASIADRVARGVAERARALAIGDPLEPSTTLGAVVSEDHRGKIEGYLRQARDLGGKFVAGGSRVAADRLPERCRRGYFLEPTVITGLDHSCAVCQEEIFGPVVTVTPFEDDDHAIALANDTPMGLAATVLTNDLSRAHNVGDRINAGIVWVNCWMLRDLRTPFGGMKDSGIGREGGRYALDFFTEAKTVCVRR